jgi:glycosyltransferase involved in cell wall biosynthesis
MPDTLSQLSGSGPRIDLVFPVLPPALDGIGDHTARLARALSDRGCRVRILTAQSSWAPLSGVAVEKAFELDPISGITQLRDAVRRNPPDVLFVQFNQFSYGSYGFNPFLPWTLYALKRDRPDVLLVWMAHEEFVPGTSVKNAVMSTWQRAQFWALGRMADAIGFSSSVWVQKFRSWFPDTPMHHLPVGSNIPRIDVPRRAARSRLQLDDSFVVGYFGSVQGSRHLEHVRHAADQLHRASEEKLTLLYIGAHGHTLRDALPSEVREETFRDAGRLDTDDVSLHFSAMDLYLAPFVAGVSTRRGSFMTSLQHGVPTLATAGHQTDPLFHEEEGDALRLVPEEDVSAFGDAAVSLYRRSDPQRRALGAAGQKLYETHFDWPVLAQTVEDLVSVGSQTVHTHSAA